MIELPEIAKSYRREPVKRGFRAFVPGETAIARERRELMEQYQREFESDMNSFKQMYISTIVREIGLHDVDSY